MTNSTKRGIRLSLFSFILVLAFCSIGMAAAATTVEIAPTTQTVDPGDSFTVKIDITPDTAVGGAQASLTFDPSLVTVDTGGVTNGGMFPGLLSGTVDNVAGTITGMAGYFTGGATTTTAGTFVVISFTADAVNTGASPLDLFAVKVTDGAGVEVPSDPKDGTVRVGSDTLTLVEIVPTTQTVNPGDSFTARIDITPDTAVGGAQASLTFDPSLVTVDTGGVTNGGMFPGLLSGTVDNVAGTITGMAGYFTGGATTTTAGTFVVISFTADAVNTGASPLDLFAVKVTDGAGVEVPSDPKDGTVEVSSLNTYYGDADGDGYGDPANTTEAESAPSGYVSDNTDCDDTNAAVNPGADEICDDGIDNDCDGYTDCADSDCIVDADGDGYNAEPCGNDCDDDNAAVNPGATEICDGIDNNCDGQIDEGCCPCDFCMPLEAGLNLVSVPRCVEVGGSSMALAVFNLSGIETCDSWDGCTGEWSDDLPNAMQVVPARAYFVYKVNAETICMNGTTYMDTQTLCIDTWAMVGFPSLDPMTVTEFRAASALGDEFLTAWQWNGGWYPMTGNSNMEPYHGYVLWMTDNGVMPGMIDII